MDHLPLTTNALKFVEMELTLALSGVMMETIFLAMGATLHVILKEASTVLEDLKLRQINVSRFVETA